MTTHFLAKYVEQRQSFEYAVWGVIRSKQFADLDKESKADILLSIEEELNEMKEEN